MIGSIPRRVTTTGQTAVTKPPAAKPEAAKAPQRPPAATPYFQDTLEKGRPSPVNLSGFGKASPAAVSARAARPDPAHFDGPRLLHLPKWTPQGQGYDAKNGEVLTTYYGKEKGKVKVLLSVQNKVSGKETLQVFLGGKGAMAGPTHGGGVSTDGEFVYVSDTKRIYVYTRKEIERAADPKAKTEAQAIQVMDVEHPKVVDPNSKTKDFLASGGSYMTVKDGYAYIGGHSDKDGKERAGAVWRYKINEATGLLDKNLKEGPIRAPHRAQGMTVVDGGLLFTTGEKKLIYQPFDADTFKTDFTRQVDISSGLIDPYAQGVNIIDGQLWVTYESGSYKYRDKLNPKDKNGENGENGERVYAPRDHIQRIPLDYLNLKAAELKPGQLKG